MTQLLVTFAMTTLKFGLICLLDIAVSDRLLHIMIRLNKRVLSVCGFVSVAAVSFLFVLKEIQIAHMNATWNASSTSFKQAVHSLSIRSSGVMGNRPHNGLNNGLLSSWRFVALTVLSPEGSSVDFDEPWNSIHNSVLSSKSSDIFCVPMSLHPRIFAISGPGTAFDSGIAYDELSKSLIVLVETADASCHWAAPCDYSLQALREKYHQTGQLPITHYYESGFFVAFADRDVWFLSKDTPWNILELFLTIEDVKNMDRDEWLNKYRLYRIDE